MDYEAREAMKALRGQLSRRATSAEFNEWMAREVCEYIDALRAQIVAPGAHGQVGQGEADAKPANEVSQA